MERRGGSHVYSVGFVFKRTSVPEKRRRRCWNLSDFKHFPGCTGGRVALLNVMAVSEYFMIPEDVILNICLLLSNISTKPTAIGECTGKEREVKQYCRWQVARSNRTQNRLYLIAEKSALSLFKPGEERILLHLRYVSHPRTYSSRHENYFSINSSNSND
jgi:hypothetical protein